jgi:hypothetical protein
VAPLSPPLRLERFLCLIFLATTSNSAGAANSKGLTRALDSSGVRDARLWAAHSRLLSIASRAP